MYDEFVYCVIAELQEWFIDNPPYGIRLSHLLSSQSSTMVDHDEICLPEKLNHTVDFYNEDLILLCFHFLTEYRMWVRQWIDCCSEESPNRLVDTLKACDPTTFPNMHIPLQLALTFPITSCESESQLKFLKTSHYH